MAKQRKTIEELAADMGTATAAPSVEDWEAEVASELGPATSDGPAGPTAPDTDEYPRQPAEIIDTGPNPDLTPPEVSNDPWWEVSCPEHGLPRRDIQAPNEAVAALLYNQSFGLRRPRPTVKRITDGGSISSSTGELAGSAH